MSKRSWRLEKEGKEGEHLQDLRTLVDAEHSRDVVLDLVEVGLVDVEGVRFLVQCETQGVRITRCPAYVREWMAREKRPP